MTHLLCIAFWLLLLPAQPVAAQQQARGEQQEEAAQETEKVYTRKEVDTPAKITKNRPPDYPHTGASGPPTFKGRLRLRAVLRADGRVTDIEMLDPVPDEIRLASVKAAAKIKFKPAIKDGRAVSQYVMIEHSYNVY